LLTRLFPAFPAGLAGMALLLFRGVLSATLLLEARSCLNAGWGATTTGLVGLAALALAALLLVGFLTPIAGLLAGMGCAFVALSGGAIPALVILDSRQSVVFAATMLFGIVVLGPGAFSVDARLFGRREIIIPPPVHPSRP
jgi:uncharacterized membrane protein YphA (DoxX/SURF4 family)